jgi:pyrroline-5-carboxylate reductase
MTFTFIGGGNMATALIGGMIARGTDATSFRVVEPVAQQREKLAARFPGVTVHPTVTREDVAGARVLVLAVKPQNMKEAAEAIVDFVAHTQVVLTIAAGIRTGDLSRWLRGYARIVRAMPNTPALVGAGITGVYAMPGLDADARRAATAVVHAVGEVVQCTEETQLDAITGVSGSGPAYVFYFLEGLEQAACELGFDAPRARQLAYSTFAGAIALAQQSNDSPMQLRVNVTSKGGTTARAIESLEDAHVKDAFVAAVRAAAHRARELGDELGKA